MHCNCDCSTELTFEPVETKIYSNSFAYTFMFQRNMRLYEDVDNAVLAKRQRHSTVER